MEQLLSIYAWKLKQRHFSHSRSEKINGNYLEKIHFILIIVDPGESQTLPSAVKTFPFLFFLLSAQACDSNIFMHMLELLKAFLLPFCLVSVHSKMNVCVFVGGALILRDAI